MTWLAYRNFHLRLRQRQPYRSIETRVDDDHAEPLVIENGRIANGKPVSASEVNETRKAAAAKDVPGCRAAVTALGKLGLIMAYFYLCDRYRRENERKTSFFFSN